MKRMNHTIWIALLSCLALLPLAAQAEVTEEWGVDRRGDDYRNFRAADLAQCQEACEREVTCRAYTFTVGENTCYLKRGPGSSQRRSGRVSGLKQGPAAPAPRAATGPLSEEWGSDHPGHDYQTFHATTLAVCKVTCREEERCRAYTYNHRTGLCYLKDDVSGRQPSQVHVTGAKGAGRRPLAADLTEEPGYDYPGHDYHSFKAEDLAFCQSACREEERCRAYSFNPRALTCYLKEETGRRDANPNTIAGTKDPRPASPAADQPTGNLTEEWGYDYRGNDYRSFRAPAYEVCWDTCAQESRCRAYTFNQRTGTCYLKERTGYRQANGDTVTGTKDRR